MKTKRITKTKKLLAAAGLLSVESFGDCTAEELIEAMEAEGVTPEQVYQYMQLCNMSWNGVYWVTRQPAWLKRVYERTDTLVRV